jgi:hypothetical protein
VEVQQRRARVVALLEQALYDAPLGGSGAPAPAAPAVGRGEARPEFRSRHDAATSPPGTDGVGRQGQPRGSDDVG